MTKNIKVTVLIENTGDEDFKCEHGLSLYIETDDKKILLDAGQTDLFLENAKELMIDLKSTDFCVLSHGHYDHSGGFKTLLEKYSDLKVHVMKGYDGEYYSGNGEMHYIGLSEELLSNHKDKFIVTDSFKEIEDGIYLVPHNTKDLEKIGDKHKLYIKREDKYYGDDFSHEMSLVIDTIKGLIIFNSCSHSGLATIIKEVKGALPGKNIYGFFGGLHMKGKKGEVEICTFTDDELDKFAKTVIDEGLEALYTGHCTGKEGYDRLESRIPEILYHLKSGRIILV